MFDEHGTIMLVIDSKTGAIMYANKAAADFYGYAIEQLESMNIKGINVLSPEETKKEIQAAASEGRNFFISKHRLANGDIRTVEVYAYPHRHAEYTILFSTVYDITAKNELAEKNRIMSFSFMAGLAGLVLFMGLVSFLLFRNFKKLQAQKLEIGNFNELRSTFIDADNSLIMLKDDNLNYVFVNKTFRDFFHKENSEIIGHNDFELLDQGLAAICRQTDLEVLEKKQTVKEELKWDSKIYQITKFPVKLINGRYGVGAYMKDVTQEYNNQRETEKALLRTQILVNVLNHNYSSTQEQLDYVLNETLKLTESKFGYIYLYSEENQEFILNSWSQDVMKECNVVEKQTKYQLEKTGLWGEVVRQKKPIIVNDFQMSNPMKKGYPKGHVQILNFMSIPLFIDEKIVAVIGLANKADDYDDNDVYQVSALMNGVWNAKERRERSIELERTYKALKENESKLQLILDSAAEGIYGVDRNGKCTFCNSSCLKMLQYHHQDELIGKNMHWKIHHSRRDGTRLPQEQCRILTDTFQGRGVHVDDEVFWRGDGTSFEAEYYAYPQEQDGEVVGAVVTFLDITDRKKAQSDILYLSYHDALTGLFNRRFFEQELKRLDTSRNFPISIIMGDVNGLKQTNDIFGHASGDQLLQKAAEVMRKACRADDIIARWGGDEFVILLPQTTKTEAETIAQRIKALFSQERIKAFRGSISLGCAAKHSVSEDIFEAVENAEEKMYEEKTLERSVFISSAVKTIIKTFHEHNPGEEEHSRRVSELCERTARAMNLDGDEVRRAKDAGFLHDIGKIVLDDSLLLKTDSLTEQEWQEIFQHPVVGYRILNSSDDTLELAKYVLHHHERWDGTGYPKGLKGEAIPKLARIIALAESYDAMCGGAPYKKALSREEALQEIKRNAGSQFDPDMAGIFAKTLQQEA